ncbi:MAG TPA: AI-2E family transporter [Herpetosiphonaceae bacterium]|nr:AI-2E family transporter [Herpetosiphonaceae bacterium]
MQARSSAGSLPPASPAPFERRWNPRRVILATLAVVSVVAGFYLIFRFVNVLFVFFVAIVLATAMRPAVLWLERRRIPQWSSVLSIYLVFGLLLAGVFALLVPLLIDQGSQIVKDVPAYYQEARGQLRGSDSQILRRLGTNLPPHLDLSLLTGKTRQQAASTGDQQSVVSQAVAYLTSFVWSLFGIIAVFLIAFFWTLDRDLIVRTGLMIVPVDKRDTAREVWETAELKVGAYIRGQGLVMLTIGILCGIAYFLIGLKSALILSILACIFEAIPYVGPILTALVVLLVTLSESPEKIWWAVGALAVIYQTEGAILVPRIMDRAVGVNPIVILLAIAAFGSLFGIPGAILAIPLAAIIQVLLDRWMLHQDDQPIAAITGRDKIAVVRYEAQDLAQDLRERIREKPTDRDQSDDSFEERIEALVGEIDELLVQVSTPASPQAMSAPGGRTI